MRQVGTWLPTDLSPMRLEPAAWTRIARRKARSAWATNARSAPPIPIASAGLARRPALPPADFASSARRTATAQAICPKGSALLMPASAAALLAQPPVAHEPTERPPARQAGRWLVNAQHAPRATFLVAQLAYPSSALRVVSGKTRPRARLALRARLARACARRRPASAHAWTPRPIRKTAALAGTIVLGVLASPATVSLRWLSAVQRPFYPSLA